MKASCVVLLALALIFVTGVSNAQTVADPSASKANVWPVRAGKSYANNQIDTSAAFSIGGCSRVSLLTVANDSCAYITNVDYRESASVAWTATAADTVTVTAGGAVTYHSWVLRNHSTEKVPGIAGQIRFRKVFSASNNGVTSATYTDQLYWRP